MPNELEEGPVMIDESPELYEMTDEERIAHLEDEITRLADYVLLQGEAISNGAVNCAIDRMERLQTRVDELVDASNDDLFTELLGNHEQLLEIIMLLESYPVTSPVAIALNKARESVLG